MKILTINAHEQVVVADIITAIQEAGINSTHKVMLYALAKAIAISYERLPVSELVSFLDDLKTAALVCHEHPNAIPPEE